MKQQIFDTYIHYTLEHNKAPDSVYSFCKILNLEEKEFYNHFSSLAAVQDGILIHWFSKVKENLEAGELYKNYNAREKLLAFFFSWFEELKGYRSFVVFLQAQDKNPVVKTAFMSGLKKDFLDWAENLMQDGIKAGEIEDRKFISNKYGDAVWVNLLFLTDFWLKDKSTSFEKTDEAIEKSVNLAFNLMGKSTLDDLLSFGKFLFQNK